MNALSFRKIWLQVCLLGAVAIPSRAFAFDDTPVLKVQVAAPAAWDAQAKADFAPLFARSISRALTDDGFLWPVPALPSGEDPGRASYLLKIEVTDWQIGR